MASLVNRPNGHRWIQFTLGRRVTVKLGKMADEFATHVVCAWLGNSPRVANAHYLQVTQEHFDLAKTRSGNRKQNRKHSVAVSAGIEGNEADVESRSSHVFPSVMRNRAVGHYARQESNTHRNALD